ncbi:MAG: MerC domain-containing protein, partial [Ginsengibacter sp.]
MKKKINWDALGAGASIACAIHCALLPVILTSLPLFGINIINNNSFEFFMIGLAFCIGTFSLYHGWKKHHRKILPLLIFTVGMGFLFAKQIWHSYHLWFLFSAVT